ncbi:hypothetical protein PG996_002354 [Apiospora saccharicola]|uniref:Uncharacterized protein n=1 Tax=Apiospora saccharicola TaxID=335842 RepID=A0ABR1WJF3_9PEZI
MSSDNSNGPSATDIITYVGVPLAVAGVLPIAYTAATTLIFRRQLLKKLEGSQAGTIRSTEILNRVVEVQYPRYRLAVSQLADNPSGPGIQPEDIYPRSWLSGGSWTFLTWHRQEIGSKIQRLTPGDAPYQPQAEIWFCDLINRLYRLGAEVVPSRWSDLRTHGTWARRGLVLMRVGTSDALVIAKSDDSDGFLALQLDSGVDWPNLQRQRGYTFSKADTILIQPTTLKGHSNRVDANDQPETDGNVKVQRSMELPPPVRDDNQETSTGPGSSSPGTTQATPILCHFSSKGLTEAEWHPASGNDDVVNRPRNIPVAHLRWREAVANQAVWFASCATASQARKNWPIVSYCIPDYILHVAQVSGLSFRALRALYESRIVVKQFYWDKASERSSSSPDCSVEVVAERGLDWLRSKNNELADLSLEDVGATVLHKMIVDPQFAKEIRTQLDDWKAYTDKAEGAPIKDVDSPKRIKIFVEATLLLVLIKRMASSPLPDVQKCISTFKYVKLG